MKQLILEKVFPFCYRPEFGADCVPLLKYMVTNGNKTMYEYRTGTEPTRVEETPLEFSLLQDDDDVIDDTKADEVSIFFNSIVMIF